MARELIGTWRIVEMQLWDADALDLLRPAFLEFNSEGHGEFQFIAVRGFMDVRFGEKNGRPRAEFSWEGDDEGDPRSGRGWAALAEDGSLVGRVFFHMGDDASFRALAVNDVGR